MLFSSGFSFHDSTSFDPSHLLCILQIFGREAVLEHLVQNVQCRGMFSTHYHLLALGYHNDPKVSLYFHPIRFDSRHSVHPPML